MPDAEVQWKPENSPAQDIPVRTRVITLAVLIVGCVVIGIVIGRLTARIPAPAGSGSSVVLSAPSAKKQVEDENQRPRLASKSGPKASAPTLPPAPPSPKAEPEADRPPVVVLNPGTADKGANDAREEARSRRQAKERSVQDSPEENRARPASELRRDLTAPPARDYQSLREHVLRR